MYYFLVAEVAKKEPVAVINNWMYISIAELLVIVVLGILLFKKKRNKRENFFFDEIIKEDKHAEVDFGNMFNSMFNDSALHDILKKKIHPDRFPNDPEKIAIANELTAQLNESQKNIAKMKEIQSVAKEKLGITF